MNNHIDNTLTKLHFDNSFIRELPGDTEEQNFVRQVTGACYSKVEPTRVRTPKLVCFSPEMAQTLGLEEQDCTSSLFTEIFSGNTLIEGMAPYAMCYGGHQFGSWAGQLGDGRAINLGEVVTSDKKRWTLQLKGAGRTPYSRSGDGLAVLRSSIREFLCSEAMYHLGIPTTRALSLVTTGEDVLRDMFYDGHPKNEPGAVVCRVSPSFIRFGNFEILAARKELSLLRRLADYTISIDFPHLGHPDKEVYIQWFHEICEKTAKLMVEWMRAGFVHGVMNTDNMSILGLTIDYGPYGWLEGFEPGWTPNTTDAQGRRYCYSNQPHIAQWNLLQLANALYPLIEDEKPFADGLELYNSIFHHGWRNAMKAKLGLKESRTENDDSLIGDLLDILQLVETDMTIFFRKLADFTVEDNGAAPDNPMDILSAAYYLPESFPRDYPQKMTHWLKRYFLRLKEENTPDKIRKKKMNSVNPKYVFRNYLAQQAIDKAEHGDFSRVEELLAVLKEPYAEQPANEKFAAKRPEWARNKAGCSMLSCSS